MWILCNIVTIDPGRNPNSDMFGLPTWHLRRFIRLIHLNLEVETIGIISFQRHLVVEPVFRSFKVSWVADWNVASIGGWVVEPTTQKFQRCSPKWEFSPHRGENDQQVLWLLAHERYYVRFSMLGYTGYTNVYIYIHIYIHCKSDLTTGVHIYIYIY